jgi:hypothetical protein
VVVGGSLASQLAQGRMNNLAAPAVLPICPVVDNETGLIS